MRKLRRADELAAEGKIGEEIAAELHVSPATLYNWRRTYGGMDTNHRQARFVKERFTDGAEPTSARLSRSPVHEMRLELTFITAADLQIP